MVHIKKQNARTIHKRGFSLVELGVVITVMTILMTTILWNYRSSISEASVDNATREVRLMLRQAQQWSNGSKSFTNGGLADTEPYDRGFGVYVTMDEPAVIRIYGGEDTTSIDYDPLNVVETRTLLNGAHIVSMCANTESTCNTADTLEIFFRRPSFSPVIQADGGGSNLAYARIVIAADDESVSDQWLLIYDSGRVEVVNPGS